MAFRDLCLLCKCCALGVLDRNPSLGTAEPVAMRMRSLPSASSFSECFALASGGRCISPEERADIVRSSPAPEDVCDV